jgi:hypothetical protein
MFDKLKNNITPTSIFKSVGNVVNGKYVTSKFFRRHLFTTVMFIWLSISLISVRFDCVTCMETISSLKTKLEVVRTETQSERSKYMTSTRESSMQHLVDSLKLGLSVQEQPPYTINYEE